MSISTEKEDLRSISGRTENLPVLSRTSPVLPAQEKETLRSISPRTDNPRALRISSTLGKEILPAKEKERLRKRRFLHLLAILLPCIVTFYIFSFYLSFLMGRSS